MKDSKTHMIKTLHPIIKTDTKSKFIMTKKLFFAIIHLAFLTLFLFDIFLIQLTDSNLSCTISIILIILIPVTLFFVFKTIVQVEIKLLRNLLLCLIILISNCYLIIGLYDALLLTSNTYPVWTDTKKRTNRNGDLIIEQTIKLSGCLYDYRTIKVYKDFGNGIRIARRWKDS